MAVIGAGGRGTYAYAPFAQSYPNLLEISAVAEPDSYRRQRFAEMYGIPEKACYSSWEPLLQEHEADGLLIANQDADHFAPLTAAMEGGWNILIEKPVTNDPKEAEFLEKEIAAYDKVLLICHVLRYTPFFRELKRILDAGTIGELIAIQHNENVGHFHQAHSFVRGHWRRSGESSPMILAKSCHDMDVLNWLMDDECEKLSSFGSLSHFKPEKAPEGSPEYCMDGCPSEETCPYSAYRYLSEKDANIKTWARAVVDHGKHKDLLEDLKKGPYGRCVYRCNNDVVDHQVVNLAYRRGGTVSFTMSAFTEKAGRTIKLMGSRGEIRGDMEKNEIETTDFRTEMKTTFRLLAQEEGHGGGDEGMIREFIKQIKTPEAASMSKSSRQGMRGHLMAFYAEKSRITGETFRL